MSTTLMDRFAVVIDAWTQRKDIDAVLAAMTEDVVWYPAVGVMPPMHGKAAVRETLERLSGQVARSHWHVVRHAEADDCLFLEGVDRNELVSGAVATVPYMGIVDFEAGLIRGWRDYLDGGLFGRAMAGKALPEHVAPLIGAADG